MAAMLRIVRLSARVMQRGGDNPLIQGRGALSEFARECVQITVAIGQSLWTAAIRNMQHLEDEIALTAR